MDCSIESSEKELNKKPNYYFIEEEISPLIMEWQKLIEKQEVLEDYLKNNQNEESIKKELDVIREKSSFILDKIMNETSKVIKGVIFKAQFHKREKYETCFQIAAEACLKSLKRFNPEYGTAFNYLSLTAKNSIRYHLIKKLKKKDLSLDYEYLDEDNLKLKNIIKQEEKILEDLEIENLIITILDLIEKEDSIKKSLKIATKELRDYLFYSKGKYDKKEFFKWAKSDGVSSNVLRKFIRFLRDHKDILYKEVGVF